MKRTLLLLVLGTVIGFSQQVPYYTRAVDTTVIVSKYIPIVLHKSGVAQDVNAYVTVYPTSTDTLFICFNDTASNFTRQIVMPSTPRQFWHRANKIYVKGGYSGSTQVVHIDVEYP